MPSRRADKQFSLTPGFSRKYSELISFQGTSKNLTSLLIVLFFIRKSRTISESYGYHPYLVSRISTFLLVALFVKNYGLTLRNKKSFPLRVSSVNVAKSAGNYGSWLHLLKKSLIENFIFLSETKDFNKNRLPFIWKELGR